MSPILFLLLVGLILVIYLEYFHHDKDELDSRGQSVKLRRKRRPNRY